MSKALILLLSHLSKGHSWLILSPTKKAKLFFNNNINSMMRKWLNGYFEWSLSEYTMNSWRITWIIIIIILIIIIIIILMSCHQHGYPWPSLATPPYRSLLLVGPEDYIPYLHRAALCRLQLVILLLLGHMRGSIGEHH